MKLGVLFMMVLAVVALNGCDVARGPAIFNGTDHALEITARFADGPSDVHLEPHQVYWQLKTGRLLESIIVIDGGQRREISSETLEPLLKRILTPDDTLVLLRTDTVEVRSIREAKREGFFTKR